MNAIRKHAKAFFAVIGLMVIAAAISLYILDQQRLRFPWEAAPLRVKAEFPTAQAVMAGQGQTVRVSGVRIGRRDANLLVLRNRVEAEPRQLAPHARQVVAG